MATSILECSISHLPQQGIRLIADYWCLTDSSQSSSSEISTPSAMSFWKRSRLNIAKLGSHTSIIFTACKVLGILFSYNKIRLFLLLNEVAEDHQVYKELHEEINNDLNSDFRKEHVQELPSLLDKTIIFTFGLFQAQPTKASRTTSTTLLEPCSTLILHSSH